MPDHLPEELKTSIKKFPAGSLQFEIGIQTFNPEVQSLVSRKQNNEKASENLRWLREESQAHLHVDLIAGLPGEDLTSFAAGFDKLVALNPHEIQFGILKRLRGTPIIRHTEKYKMVFDAFPPYSIVETDRLDFSTMQRLNRFARYWDLVANSGRFSSTLPKILSDSPFKNFLALSDWLYDKTDATHKIALDRLATLIKHWLVEQGMSTEEANELVGSDYAGKIASTDSKNKTKKISAGVAPDRQARHLAA